MTEHRARRMWALIEPVHDVTYFAECARPPIERLGVSGFWAGYVLQRVAPLGPVGPELATAVFYGCEAWQAGIDRLRERGVVDLSGRLTPEGQALHERIESATDEAADPPWRALGAARTAELAELLAPLSGAVVGAGIPPARNAVGLATSSAR